MKIHIQPQYFASSPLEHFLKTLKTSLIPTNDFLYKIKINDSELCDFCQDKSETLLHLFWSCKFTEKFWLAVENWLHEKVILDKQRTIDKLDAIGLNCHAEHTLLSFCKLTARCYMYTSKKYGQIPKFSIFINQIKKTMPLSKKNSSQLRNLKTNGDFYFHLANQRTGHPHRVENWKPTHTLISLITV